MKFRETPAIKYPPPPGPFVRPARMDGKSRTTLLWVLEYLKCKYPEDKDAIQTVINMIYND